jgi:hypothetical protein
VLSVWYREEAVMRAAIERCWRQTPAPHQPAAVWQTAPPSGPVVFDPSLRTAGELMAETRTEHGTPSSPPKAA